MIKWVIDIQDFNSNAEPVISAVNKDIVITIGKTYAYKHLNSVSFFVIIDFEKEYADCIINKDHWGVKVIAEVQPGKVGKFGGFSGFAHSFTTDRIKILNIYTQSDLKNLGYDLTYLV